MTEKWTPFGEGQQDLRKYEFFFSWNILRDYLEESSQDIEDMLNDSCPENYCYVILHGSRYGPSLCMLLGVPEDIAIAIKIKYGIDTYCMDKVVMDEMAGKDHLYLK